MRDKQGKMMLVARQLIVVRSVEGPSVNGEWKALHTWASTLLSDFYSEK